MSYGSIWFPSFQWFKHRQQYLIYFTEYVHFHILRKLRIINQNSFNISPFFTLNFRFLHILWYFRVGTLFFINISGKQKGGIQILVLAFWYSHVKLILSMALFFGMDSRSLGIKEKIAFKLGYTSENEMKLYQDITWKIIFRNETKRKTTTNERTKEQKQYQLHFLKKKTHQIFFGKKGLLLRILAFCCLFIEHKWKLPGNKLK